MDIIFFAKQIIKIVVLIGFLIILCCFLDHPDATEETTVHLDVRQVLHEVEAVVEVAVVRAEPLRKEEFSFQISHLK